MNFGLKKWRLLRLKQPPDKNYAFPGLKSIGNANVPGKPVTKIYPIGHIHTHVFRFPCFRMNVGVGLRNKLIVQNVNAESFVQYARIGGIKERRIVGRYVIRNAMLPQFTNLALSLGQIFSGAFPFVLITLAVTIALMVFPQLSLALL